MKDPISLFGLALVGALCCAGQEIPAACVAAALALRAGTPYAFEIAYQPDVVRAGG